MSYAGQRVILDADSHLMEDEGWLERYADRSLHARFAPLFADDPARMSSEANVRRVWGEARAMRQEPDYDARAGKEVVKGRKGWFAYGATDGNERRKAMDDLGFRAQLVFATFSLLQFIHADNDDILYGGALAQSRGMADFCGGDPRLLPVCPIPIDNPALTLSTFREAQRLGIKAAWIPHRPPRNHSPGHSALDPFWAALAEAGVPAVIHVGGAASHRVPRSLRDRGQHEPDSVPTGGESVSMLDYVGLHHAAEQFLAAMILHGVFKRHPKLKVGVIELGAGWVPNFMNRIDAAATEWARSEPYVKKLSLRPSDYVWRQMRFTPFPFEDVGQMIKASSSALYMFSSDYPHPEGTRDPVGRFDATLGELGASDRDAFYSGNFATLMG